MDKKVEISLLYDFYKELLNPSQQRVIELCVNEDLSLSEAAELLSISRQGVRDAFSRAEDKLRGYERRLGLLDAYTARTAATARIRQNTQQIRQLSDSREIHALLDEIDTLLEKEE